MAAPLRILIADDEPLNVLALQSQLEALGHQVVAAAHDGGEAVAMAEQVGPELAILDIRMPDLSGIEAAARIFETSPIPIILVSAYSDPDAVLQAARTPVYQYLVKPVELEDLGPAISVAVTRFSEWIRLRREAGMLEQKLEDRRLIEQAKGILMEVRGLPERDAYRMLQKESQNTNRPMAEVARNVITAHELLAERTRP
jgi:two-component system, response regulator PdtaR